jgi:uncharacterized protein involved in exopolysaccharide biosynthesis
VNIRRGIDFINALVLCYNDQANIDKNEIAMKTEEFINGRLEKINAELGATEGELEDYKQRNNITQLRLDASQVLGMSNQYTNLLADANTEMQLLDYLNEYITDPKNKYQLIPSNVGLTDPISATLINTYNQDVLSRNKILQSASENSPQVMTFTNTLDRTQVSIKEALMQARKAAEIKRKGIQSQFNLYQSKVANTPKQERVLTQIGRQQEVRSGLYLLLLEKREENSLTQVYNSQNLRIVSPPLGKLKPVFPKKGLTLVLALSLGLCLPACLLFMLLNLGVIKKS